MKKYFIKILKKGRVDVVRLAKGDTIQRTSSGVIVIRNNSKGHLFKGFHVVKAMDKETAITKALYKPRTRPFGFGMQPFGFGTPAIGFRIPKPKRRKGMLGDFF